MKNILSNKTHIVVVLLFILGITMLTGTTHVSANDDTQQKFSVFPKSSGPLGPQGQPLDNIENMIMPTVDSEKLILEDQQRQPGEPPRFAESLETMITPETHGTWEILNDDIQLWRLHIISRNAVSLNLGFTQYYMPEGGQLYIYTTDYGEVLGPYTSQDNTEYGQLWTPIINADELVIEISLPQAVVDELQLELTAVNHGYQDFEQAEKSGACNVDTICSVADSWRSEIRSVGRYTFSGSYLCTGALINNTAQDRKPYFLTANHCLSTSSAAATVVVYWNYQSATCRAINSVENGTPISTAGFPTQSGAILRATYAPSDMTLLELSRPVSSGINSYFSGWDRRDANASSVVAIHHPRGHEKRISFSNQPTTITSYSSNTIPGSSTHLRVNYWNLGTTEGGSSGSPLFNQNRHIIGQLHGGSAACGNTLPDWYGRLYTSWTGGGSNSTRLSNWLDPSGSGALVLNGIEGPAPVVDVFEPDNDYTLASSLTAGYVRTRTIIPASDVDWAKFTIDTNSAISIETSGPTNSDTRMWLYNSSLTELEFDDDDGPGLYSLIDRVCGVDALSPGTYYIKVDEFGNNQEIPEYQILYTYIKPCSPPWDTVGVFRPTNGNLYLKNLNVAGFADVAINYGLGGDYPVVGDWDGNGTDTIGVYRNDIFYLRNSNTIGFANISVFFGAPGDQPIAGDWDGDGVDTIGVYRSTTGTFFLRNSNTAGPAQMVFSLGIPGDIAIAGDWDGNGIDTVGVFRPSNGVIFLKNTNATGYADIALNYGLAGDRPVVGDWNGDGIDTIGIYRNGRFYLRNYNTPGYANIIFDLGNAGDMPIAGEWDNLP